MSVERIADDLRTLMAVPGLSGHEDRVRRAIAERLDREHRTDRLGNLVATVEGDPSLPSVMVFAHMDQLGFVVRRIEGGFVRLERLGGVPERALAGQLVLFQIGKGRDRHGVVANKSHHATLPDEKYRVVPYRELYVDTGLDDAEAVRAAGIEVGTPVVYAPRTIGLSDTRIAGPAVDDRAGCAVLLEVSRRLATHEGGPTVHIVFSTQEEFNLRGVVPMARALAPDIAIQIDLALTGDTPDMGDVTDVRLGGGPVMSLYSFHGRGTLNGLIPHPALPPLAARAAEDAGVPLQRSAQTGILTETSYVQLEGEGIACIDLAFPCRYTHSALEVCDVKDLAGLADVIVATLAAIEPNTLER